MRQKTMRLLGLLVLAMIIRTPAAHAGTRIFVQISPPAPVVVAPVPPPAPYGYVWQPGYYVWAGAAYRWAPGVWVRPPYARAVWVGPRWIHERRGWYMAPGHWHRR
jgi:hypothetical protein